MITSARIGRAVWATAAPDMLHASIETARQISFITSPCKMSTFWNSKEAPWPLFRHKERTLWLNFFCHSDLHHPHAFKPIVLISGEKAGVCAIPFIDQLMRCPYSFHPGLDPRRKTVPDINDLRILRWAS